MITIEKLTQAGITTEQLEKLAKGEAWVAEWVEHEKASPTKEEPYLLWDYGFKTPIVCKYHEKDEKVYAAQSYDIGLNEVVQCYTNDAGCTAHMMSFNGNNGIIPTPAKAENEMNVAPKENNDLQDKIASFEEGNE